MSHRCSCNSLPVSPLQCCPVGAGAAMPDGEDIDLGDDDAVNKDHAVFGDPIIGYETELKQEPEALEAIAAQTPKGMTAAQWAKHRLTHLPYCDGGPICAVSRRPNTQHRTSIETDKVVPLLVRDYCFLNSMTDSKHLTIWVVRIMPCKLFFTTVVPAKGSVPEVVIKLSQFIREAAPLSFLLQIRQGVGNQKHDT